MPTFFFVLCILLPALCYGEPPELSGPQEMVSYRNPETSPPVKHGHEKLAKGVFLVAETRIKDPNFSETVVFLLEYGPAGAIGLIVNRQTGVPLEEAFPKIEGLEEKAELLYFGGPVSPAKVILLVKSADKPDESERVIGDIHASTSRALLLRLVNKPSEGELFRAYAGYAGWSSGQLEAEVARGDWHILQADPGVIFGKDLSGMWQRLLPRSISI